MSIKERFAFDKGRSCIKYFKDGSKVLTGGIIGDVFVFSGIEDTIDEYEAFTAGEEVLGLAISEDERIFVAPKIEPGDKGCNEVLAFKYEEFKGVSDGTICKFTAEATCVDCSKDGKFVAAGSADMTLKVIETESFKVKKFEGHSAPILNVALDPKNEFVLSSACDGSAKLWNVEKETCVLTWSDLWDETNDTCRSKTTAMLAWHPDGSSFAIPTKNGIKLCTRVDFSLIELDANSEEYYTAVAFSTDGNHLVGGTLDGKIMFWNLRSKARICQVQSDSPSMISAIEWNPSEPDEIAFIKEDGHWGTVTKFLNGLGSKNTKVSKTVDEENMDADELAAALFDDDDDDDNENSFSIRAIKKETGFLEDQDEATNQTSATNDDKADVLSIIQDEKPDVPKPIVQATAPRLEVDLQEPFQPGSTPVHLKQRFMVWNSVGIVQSFESEDESFIDVEFHDTSVHHPIHLGNSNGYIMADLSTEAVLLASEADEAEGANVPSKLTCHHFGASGLFKEWSVDMPDTEDIMAICCGNGWVKTSKLIK